MPDDEGGAVIQIGKRLPWKWIAGAGGLIFALGAFMAQQGINSNNMRIDLDGLEEDVGDLTTKQIVTERDIETLKERNTELRQWMQRLQNRIDARGQQ